MKLPRDLDGDHLAVALCRGWGYRKVHQVGSHVILETTEPTPQRIAIPSHKALRVGTLNAIPRVVAQHKEIRKQDLLNSL